MVTCIYIKFIIYAGLNNSSIKLLAIILAGKYDAIFEVGRRHKISCAKGGGENKVIKIIYLKLNFIKVNELYVE